MGVAYFLALITFFLQGVCFPYIPVNPFAPYIALSVLSYRFRKDFWRVAILCIAAGGFLDLFCNHPIGIYACSYPFAAAILFRYRNRLFYDRPLHLALFTSTTSLLLSFFQVFFLFLFDRRLAIPGEWVIVQSVGVALLDGVYALIWFSGFLYLYMKIRRIWTLFRLKGINDY